MRNIRSNIIILLLILYLMISFFLLNNIDNSIFNLVINPLFWILLSIYLFNTSNNDHGRFHNLNDNFKTLLIITLFYIIFYFLGGIIFGYARNPFSIDALLKNIYQILIVLIGMEYTRSFLINKNKKSKIKFFLITLLFILFDLNLSNIILNFNTKVDTFKYVSNVLIPIISSNILYSYLTLKGSYKLVLIYRLPIELLTLILPILPNYSWFIKGIIGILMPAIIYIVLNYFIDYRINIGKNRKNYNIYKDIPFFIIVIIFSLFVSGAFSLKPMAVLSNSMVPVFYRGDIVIYRKIDNNKLKNIELNTIIIYNKDGQAIVHRVVDKYKSKGDTYYITKGDANKSNDRNPVSESQVIGIYKCNIKYIGYPSVWLNEYFNKEKALVETGEKK